VLIGRWRQVMLHCVQSDCTCISIHAWHGHKCTQKEAAADAHGTPRKSTRHKRLSEPFHIKGPQQRYNAPWPAGHGAAAHQAHGMESTTPGRDGAGPPAYCAARPSAHSRRPSKEWYSVRAPTLLPGIARALHRRQNRYELRGVRRLVAPSHSQPSLAQSSAGKPHSFTPSASKLSAQSASRPLDSSSARSCSSARAIVGRPSGSCAQQRSISAP